MKSFNVFSIVRTMFLMSALLLFPGCRTSQHVRESGTHYAEEALKPYIESGELPGAISIFYNNGVQETTCVGWADVEKKIPMSMDRMFMQCSQTKGVCGVSMAILLEEGKVSLDDPVSKYLPEFKNMQVLVKEGETFKLVPAKNELTIRMIMNHSGGFPFNIPSKDKHGIASKSLRESAKEAAANPLLFEPGTGNMYSNTGIDIAAAIIEVVTGQKWEDFLQERIFKPLKMSDATFNPTDEQLSRRIITYDLHANKPATPAPPHPLFPLPYNGPGIHPSAAGGLWLTAADQLKFYKMLMNCGVSEDGVRILKEETVRKYISTSTLQKHLGSYSMGIYIENGWFGHGGALQTVCMVNQEKKQLWIWVVQLIGGPTPWGARWEAAKQQFFAQETEGSGVKDYTGRIK